MSFEKIISDDLSTLTDELDERKRHRKMRQDILWWVTAIKDGQIKIERSPSDRKAALASCIAMTSSENNDTPVQPQTQAMGAASGDPGGGEIPVMRRQPQLLLVAPGSGSCVELGQYKENDLMPYTIGVATISVMITGGPNGCFIKNAQLFVSSQKRTGTGGISCDDNSK